MLKAIRENEPRAISLGYDAERYKLIAFVLSATLAGLAGAIKALVFQLASLTDVHWTMSGEVVLMTLLGGMGTVFGPVVGAFIDHRARELPRRLRRMGDGHHRRDLRRLRPRVPARLRRRAGRMVGQGARLIDVRPSGGGAAASRRRNLRRGSSIGSCRDGQPHGRYELRDRRGKLRVAGAFNRGRRTGSFIFWTAAGSRCPHPLR